MTDAATPISAPSARRNSPAYVLTVLTLASFFNYMDRSVIAILVEPIKHELQLSDTQMGLIAGFAFAMFYAVLGLPLARIADRRSRVTLVSVSLALWSVMTAVTGLARSFIELFAARVGVGVGEAGCVPAAHSILGDLYSSQRRSFAISIFQAGGVLGQSAGLAMAAIIAQFWGWRIALVSIGLVGIPLALLIFLTVREPLRGSDHEKASSEPILATLKALAARAPVVHIILGVGVAAFGSYGISQWLAAFFIRSHGLTLAQVGAYIGATGGIGAVLGMVFGGYVVTHLVKRDVRWELWWPSLVFALYPALMLPSLLVGNLALVLVLQLLAFFVGSAGAGVALSSLQTYVEPHRRAMAVAITLMMSALLGIGLGPVAVGMISDLLTPHLGAESLRYALIALLFMPIWASIHFWLAAKSSSKWAIA